ncbi:MAG: xanthine dehydrogenase family protein [Deltaproteobacteria bacterium]|nr:xanthine dehydrogenase family protein [Deltaproteobacteria bacterium]
MPFEGVLHGVTVRSTVPHGRLVGIRFDPAFDWSDVVVVTAKDIPGDNVVTLIEGDQPYLVDTIIRHPDEAVVLLACADRWKAIEARGKVHLDVEPLPAALDLDTAARADVRIFGEDNVFKRIAIDKGDVEAAFARPDVIVVEGEYTTGAQEQLYIEPQGMVAIATPEAVTVWGSLQCPYYVHKALKPLFHYDADKVRVVQATTGGGFGGKEEYPSMIAGHAALLSLKAGGRPVKIIYDRAEDMTATTKRHPSRTRHRTAVTREGELVAMDIAFDLDGGAYATLSAVVLSRGTIHSAGPYRCPNVRIRSRALATNHPPHGAFRGFGAPQSCFAVERHLDQVAKAVGLGPDELRRRNLLRTGDTTATEQVVEEAIDLQHMLDTALARSGWHDKRAAYEAANADPKNPIKRGLGLATFFHGSGFTGSGEVNLASVAGAEAKAGGVVEVLAASTEIGQGATTIFAQVAADALDLPYDLITVARPDTGVVPNSGPTVASRTTMVVGKLVERACKMIRARLVSEGLLAEDDRSITGWGAAVDRWLAAHPGERLVATAQYEPPPGIVWDDKRYRGSAYACYGWAAYVADVAVDTRTYEARVEHFFALQDIGTVVHPLLAAGQVEGGVAQAIGWALYEGVVWKDGHMVNHQMTNYIMPTAADVPPIEVEFQAVPFAYGPGGAKGVGELPMDGPAPAVLNAIDHALGVSIPGIPALPETIMQALRGGAA